MSKIIDTANCPKCGRLCKIVENENKDKSYRCSDCKLAIVAVTHIPEPVPVDKILLFGEIKLDKE